MSEYRSGALHAVPTAGVDWNAVADRKAVELIERYGVVTITAADREKLIGLVGSAYLQGRRDEVKLALDVRRGDDVADA